MKHKKMLMAKMPLTALAAIMMASPALADHHGGDKAHNGEKKQRAGVLERLDSDGDGRISRDEFLAPHIAKFEKMDADGDGYVSAEEMQAAREAMKERYQNRHGERSHRRDRSGGDEAAE